VIHRDIQFIDTSALRDVTLISISIEVEIEVWNERFGFRNDFLIDAIDHKLIHYFLNSSHTDISADV
jgi:hypothetical protein